MVGLCRVIEINILSNMEGQQRKRKLIAAAIVGLAVFSLVCIQPTEEELPQSPTAPMPSLQVPAGEATTVQALLLLAAMEIRNEKRFRSDCLFWELYDNADHIDWYKEYRMRKGTFNEIVDDCMPFLYDFNNSWTTAARKKYLRRKAKLCIGTFIRYLATQSDQHAIAKEFGIRQPAVSKRIRRAVHAILSAYGNNGCEKPKIVFPNESERLASHDFFFERTGRIPYLIEIIDGTIILLNKPVWKAKSPVIFLIDSQKWGA